MSSLCISLPVNRGFSHGRQLGEVKEKGAEISCMLKENENSVTIKAKCQC